MGQLRLPLPTLLDHAVEIGCGRHFAYTADWLRLAAARELIGQVTLIDPALDEDAVAGSVRFEGASCREVVCHSGTWASWAAARRDTINICVAIQTSSLLPPAAFKALHRDLRRALAPNGLFIDIAEDDDRVTDPARYGDIRLYSRTTPARVAVAEAAGLRCLHRVSVPAHADAPDDVCVMVGLLFGLTPREGN